MLKKVLIVLAALALLIISPFLISSAAHDINLAHFARQLYQCQMPNDTAIIEKHSICGKLNGNGNGMDYLAVILVKSGLPADELYRYFSGIGFNPAGEHGVIDIEIQKQEAVVLSTKYLEHGSIMFSSLENKTDDSAYYAVIIYDGGYSSGFDPRGG